METSTKKFQITTYAKGWILGKWKTIDNEHKYHSFVSLKKINEEEIQEEHTCEECSENGQLIGSEETCPACQLEKEFDRNGDEYDYYDEKNEDEILTFLNKNNIQHDEGVTSYWTESITTFDSYGCYEETQQFCLQIIADMTEKQADELRNMGFSVEEA